MENNTSGVSVIITSFREENIIGRCIESIVSGIKAIEIPTEILVAAPDLPTIKATEDTFIRLGFDRFRLIQDAGVGKWNAINEAVSASLYDTLIFTDGDVYLKDNAISKLIEKSKQHTKLAGVGGHPIPTNSRDSRFGYYSDLFCAAADHHRSNPNKYTPMTGYLMLVKKTQGLFPLPQNLKAEDAYISAWLYRSGYILGYAKDAIVYVKFPNNEKEWLDQKIRSLGGNIQLTKFTAYLPQNKRTVNRSVMEDLEMATFPLFFAKNLTEIGYSISLYLLRAKLWFLIYFRHLTNQYSVGTWKRIESTKA